MKTKILITAIIFSSFFAFSAWAASETQIFYDDFESGNDNWSLDPGWSVISENGNNVLQGTQHSFATTFLEGTANKLELKLKLLNGSIHLNMRAKSVEGGLNRYFIGLNPGDSRISKQLGDDFFTLQSGGGSMSVGEWHKIKIEIIGRRINVYSDDNLIVFAEDENIAEEGGVSFETVESTTVYIDDVRVETAVPEAREWKAQELFPDGEHSGDFTLQGRDFLILENGKFTQFGNIYLKDKAKLVIKNSEFKITKYQKLLNHWGIYLEDGASLEIESSRLVPGEALFVVEASGRSKISMKNSPTKIHLFTTGDNATALVENSEIISDIGGLVGAHGRGKVEIVNSKIGAVNLEIPRGATFEAEGLRTGFFKKWSLQEDTKVSGIDYDISLINTELVKDTIGPGPFERGWPVFIDSGAEVKIKNSELRKVVVELYDEKAEFADFSLNKPADFNYRDIHLENVIVKGQWGIFLHGSSDVVVRDSDAFWTFIYDDSKLTLINTHMNEFDPRDFRGEIIFENSQWDTAAEIIRDNDFIMSGSLTIGEIGGFSWEDSKVERVYTIIGKPHAEFTVTKDSQIFWSGTADGEGKADFSIQFDDTNFNDSWLIKDNFRHEKKVTFFSKTPMDIEQNAALTFIEEIKVKIPPFPPRFQDLLKGGPPILVFVVSLYLLRRYLKKRGRMK